MWPHTLQPTRLPRPWDSPGKNTGVGCHFLLQCRQVKSASEVAQSSLTPSDPMNYSLPGSSVHGIFQARVLEWGAIAFSNAGKWKVKVKSLSHLWLPATPWTTAYQAPLSMGFSRQEYWSGVPLPSPNYWWSLANFSWFVDTSLQSLPPSSLCPNFLLLIKTLDIVLGPTFTQYDLNFTSAKIRFPSKFTLAGSRG